jgi:sulfite reductase (NADPH) flavoprotein alpha-component
MVIFMALTGLILSLEPLISAASVSPIDQSQSVASVASRAAASITGIERLVRLASGQIVAFGRQGVQSAQVIDPTSGEPVADYAPSGFFSLVTELHRSLLLGEAGRVTAGIASVVVLALAVTGIGLLITKMGGWRNLLGRARGTGTQRLHTGLGRIAVAVLLLTATTGTYMSLVFFELLPSTTTDELVFPPIGDGSPPAPIASLVGLAEIPLTDLRELIYPMRGDPTDVFTLTSAAGRSYVDQSTGAVLSFLPRGIWERAYELIYALHTGSGIWMLSMALGAGALAVLILAATGLTTWLRHGRRAVRVADNAGPGEADVALLVGSETGVTWGFAAAAHRALSRHGFRVRTEAMSRLRREYPRARLLLIFAATYGDGAPPASARNFLRRLRHFRSRPPFAVLGFGDHAFPNFCGYAATVEAVLKQRDLEPVLPTYGIDRQSAAEFAAWGEMLGARLGMQELQLTHVPQVPPMRDFVLVERELYGVEVQAPVAVLRFRPRGGTGGFFDRRRTRSLSRFEVGDLLGVVPSGQTAPRYYSLASDSRDGYLEICVRKHPGGICSEYLHALAVGGEVKAFIRPNPDFRPSRARRPLILIGAGTGIAPLAGFVRNNRRRPVHLFFGARHPNSDFLYRAQFQEALADGRLASLTTAFSRVLGGSYVQARLLEEGAAIAELVQRGAQIMVCGGREMANGVRLAIDVCLEPLDLSVEELKRKGLYLEDAY